VFGFNYYFNPFFLYMLDDGSNYVVCFVKVFCMFANFDTVFMFGVSDGRLMIDLFYPD